IAAEWKIAKEIPEKMISFKTKILDQWVMAANNGYMDMRKWKACEVRELPIDLTGRPVFVGFDMSSKDLERSAATLRKINSVNSVKAKQKDNKRPKDKDIRIYLQNHQYYQRKSIYWTDNTRVQKEVSM
ncbi:MAG: hypothetical protein PUB12_08270, partial [[Clostridium] aminophilum]|nr:hypothetical protein [[Clostridium] aminophilum]